MFLKEFFDTFLAELETFIEDTLRLDGPSDKLRRQLRILCGRGAVDQATFFRLLGRLEQGHYIEGELHILQRQARARLPDLEVGWRGSAPLEKSLESVYLNRARLVEARAAMQQALNVLEGERDWLARQAGDFHQRAQRELPDESAARDYLEIRQQCLEQAERIAQRLEHVKQEQRRMDRLEALLRFYESELLLLRSREQLAAVELSIQKRLRL